MPTKDQVVWRAANVAVGGESRLFHAGDVLPDPASDEEAHIRRILRLGGAIRAVEVVFTPEELAAAGQARAAAQVTAEGQAEIPAAPVAPAGATPVIVGAEDDAAPKSRPGRPAGGKA